MAGLLYDLLYRVLDEPRDRAVREEQRREREVVALEKIAAQAVGKDRPPITN